MIDDFMLWGMDWLNETLKANCPVEATYTRGGETIAIVVRLGRTIFASNRQGGPRIEFGEIDFLIDAADLVLNESRTQPAEGDRIALTLRSIAYTFEILPVGGEPAWRWSDEYRTCYRVHCKEVG